MSAYIPPTTVLCYLLLLLKKTGGPHGRPVKIKKLSQNKIKINALSKSGQTFFFCPVVTLVGAFFYAHILSGIDFFFAKKSSKCHRDEKQVIFRESIWNTHFSDKMGRLP